MIESGNQYTKPCEAPLHAQLCTLPHCTRLEVCRSMRSWANLRYLCCACLRGTAKRGRRRRTEMKERKSAVEREERVNGKKDSYIEENTWQGMRAVVCFLSLEDTIIWLDITLCANWWAPTQWSGEHRPRSIVKLFISLHMYSCEIRAFSDFNSPVRFTSTWACMHSTAICFIQDCKALYTYSMCCAQTMYWWRVSNPSRQDAGTQCFTSRQAKLISSKIRWLPTVARTVLEAQVSLVVYVRTYTRTYYPEQEMACSAICKSTVHAHTVALH